MHLQNTLIGFCWLSSYNAFSSQENAEECREGWYKCTREAFALLRIMISKHFYQNMLFPSCQKKNGILVRNLWKICCVKRNKHAFISCVGNGKAIFEREEIFVEKRNQSWGRLKKTSCDAKNCENKIISFFWQQRQQKSVGSSTSGQFRFALNPKICLNPPFPTFRLLFSRSTFSISYSFFWRKKGKKRTSNKNVKRRALNKYEHLPESPPTT